MITSPKWLALPLSSSNVFSTHLHDSLLLPFYPTKPRIQFSSHSPFSLSPPLSLLSSLLIVNTISFNTYYFFLCLNLSLLSSIKFSYFSNDSLEGKIAGGQPSCLPTDFWEKSGLENFKVAISRQAFTI